MPGRTNNLSFDYCFNEDRKHDDLFFFFFFGVNLKSPTILTGEKKPWPSDRCIMKCRLYVLQKEMIQDAQKGYSSSLTISNEMWRG